MSAISSIQIKAARAMLDWSQYDLASATGLSDTTIGNLESGQMSPRSSTASVIRRVLENAGLEFIEPEGVRMRRDDVMLYDGADSCDQLFDDILHTIKAKGGEVVSIFRSPREVELFCDNAAINNFRQLKQVSDITVVKHLVSDSFEPPDEVPTMQFRMAPKQSLGTASFISYGNKCALIMLDDKASFKFVVFSLIGIVQDYRGHFYSLWNNALPLAVKQKPLKRRRAKG